MTSLLAIIRTAAVVGLLCILAVAPVTEALLHGPDMAQTGVDHDHAKTHYAEAPHHHGQSHGDAAEHDHTSAVILPVASSLTGPNTAGHLTALDRQMAGLAADGLRRPPRHEV